MVRVMTCDDAGAVHEIFVCSLGYEDCAVEVVERRIAEGAGDGRRIMLVFEAEDGTVQGFLHAERYDTLHNEGGWNLVNLGVLPEAQGEGIGRQLLVAFEELAAARGGALVRLNSSVVRSGAHAFYEHLGYTCDKVQKHFVKDL